MISNIDHPITSKITFKVDRPSFIRPSIGIITVHSSSITCFLYKKMKIQQQQMLLLLLLLAAAASAVAAAGGGQLLGEEEEDFGGD